MNKGDPDVDLLLDLDGYSFAAGPRGNYVVMFVVKQVPPTAERPHGLRYSFTLHGR